MKNLSKWEPKNLKSKEAQFLYEMVIAEGLDKIQHPVFGALMIQVIKMLSLIDEDEGKQARIRGILDRIKGEW